MNPDFSSETDILTLHIRQALRLMREQPEASQAALAQLIAERVTEGSEEAAWQLAEFIPMAYARVFFGQGGVKFDDRYCRRLGEAEDSGISHCCPLANEPIWRTAISYAQQEMQEHSEGPIVAEGDEDSDGQDGGDIVERFGAVMLRCEFALPLWERVGRGEDISGGRVLPAILQRVASLPCPAPERLPALPLMEAVRRGAEVLAENRETDAAGLHIKLVEALGDEDLAHRIVEFVPEAYASVILGRDGLELYPFFARKLDDGSYSHECPLTSEPIWDLAMRLVRYEEAQRFAMRHIFPVLSRSHLFKAVQEIANRGMRLSQIPARPLLLERPAPMPSPAPAELESIFGNEE